MLKVDRKIVQGVRSANKAQDLYSYLQSAVELEHATIPPYLTAMFSLMPDKNQEIARLIRSIVIEEMLHMTIAANVLIAIGGHPQINSPAFVPQYPGTLPMNIGNGLIVPIKRFSKDLVKDVFMVIEEPKDPIEVKTLRGAEQTDEFATIGEFYTAIQEKILEFGNDAFIVGPEQQVLAWFDSDKLWPIVDVRSANSAIELIKVEGEGTSRSPFESPGEPAHYYRFGEIYHGRKIVETADGGYAYAGDPIPFDESGVYPMIDNPKPSDFEPGSEVARLSEIFSFDYSSVLNALHQCFNGSPQNINTAMGLMYQLRLDAQTLMQTPVREGCPETAGPVFRYVTKA